MSDQERWAAQERWREQVRVRMANRALDKLHSEEWRRQAEQEEEYAELQLEELWSEWVDGALLQLQEGG